MEKSTITAKKRKSATTKPDPTLNLPEITIPFPTPPPISIETPSGKIIPEEFPSYSSYNTSVMDAQYYVTYANSEFFPWLQGKRANSVYMRAFPYGFRYQVPPELIGKVSCWNFVPKELRGPCKSAISKKEAHQTAQYKCAGCRLKRGRCSLMPNDFDELQAMWQHAQDHGYTFDRANRRAFAKEENNLQNKRTKKEKETTSQEPEIKGQKHSENEIPFESIGPPATRTKTIPKQALLVLNNPPKSTSEISNSATVPSINQTKDLTSPYCHIFDLSSSCPSHEAQYWDVLDIGKNVVPQVFQGPRSFKLFGTMITPKSLPLPPVTPSSPPPTPSPLPSPPPSPPPPSPFSPSPSPSSSASYSSSTSSCPSSSALPPSFVPPSPLPSSPSPLSSPSLPSSPSSPSLPSSSFLLSSASSASPSSSTIYSSPSTSSFSSSTSPSSAYTSSSSTKSASPPSSPSLSSSSPYSSSSSTKSTSSPSSPIFSSLSSSSSSSHSSSSPSSSSPSPSSSKSASSPSTSLSPSSTAPSFSYSSHVPSSPPLLDLSKPEIIDLTID